MRISSTEIQPVCPEGWYYKTSVTMLAPDGQGNVIASSEPLDPSMDTDRYATVQLELLRGQFHQFSEHANGRLDLEGTAAIWRRFSWSPPDGLPVTQLQLYAVANGRGYTATATTPTSNWERYEEVFHNALRSIVISTAAASERRE